MRAARQRAAASRPPPTGRATRSRTAEPRLSTLFPGDGGKAVGSIATTFEASVTHLHAAFDMRIDAADTTTPAGSAPIVFYFALGDDAHGGTTFVNLLLTPQGPQIFVQFFPVDAGESDMSYPLTRTIPMGTWTRVDIDFQYAGGTPIVSTAIADASALAPTMVIEAGAPGPLGVNLGAAVFGPTTGWSVHFDDFSLAYQ